MTPEQAFLAAIVESPEDMAPRLMYADWLEERGDVRGEFIRLQIRLDEIRPGPEAHKKAANLLARHSKGAPIRIKSQTPATLLAREQLLLSAHAREWVAIIPEVTPSHWSAHNPTPYLVLPGGNKFVNVEFRRGFVEHVSLTTADWLAHGPALVRAAPLREVRLVDREPDDRWHEGAIRRYGWFLPGEFAEDPEDVAEPIWKLLSGLTTRTVAFAEWRRWKWYTKPEHARIDLSRAALLWARDETKRRAPAESGCAV